MFQPGAILLTFLFVLVQQINFHHPDIPCDEFDVDLEAHTANCVEAGFNTEGDDEKLQEIQNRGITAANTKGPIISLAANHPNGIE